MDLIKSVSYIDIFYAKICATTKIRTVAGYHVVLAALLFWFCHEVAQFCSSLESSDMYFQAVNFKVRLAGWLAELFISLLKTNSY